MISKRPGVMKIHSLSRINKDLGRLFSQNILAKSFVLIICFFGGNSIAADAISFRFMVSYFHWEKVHFFSEVRISPNQFQRNPRVFG